MFRRIAALLAILWFCAGPARADWMNLTGAETAPNIAEITVLDDRVRLALDIYIGVLDYFIELLPDDRLKTAEGARRPRPRRAESSPGDAGGLG